jgi:hypothetical protein
MAEAREKETAIDNGNKSPEQHTLPAGVDDVGAIPKGHIDPVYEAKARVLNHAVGLSIQSSDLIVLTSTDPRYWHGLVSMAALHRCRLWLG